MARFAKLLARMPKALLAMSCYLLMIMQSYSAKAEDFRDGFPQIMTMSPHGVNLQTGRFEISETDFTIGPLSVQRRGVGGMSNGSPSGSTNVSNMTQTNILTQGYGIVYNLRGVAYWRTVGTAGGGSATRLYIDVNGQKLEFSQGMSGTVNWGFESRGWSLVTSGTDFVLTNSGGTIYRYSTHSGLASTGWSAATRTRILTSVVEPNGHRLDYTYSSAAALLSVASNMGYRINFTYDNAANSITVCGFNLSVDYATATTNCSASPLKVVYGFVAPTTDSMSLSTVTHPDGTVTTYVLTNGRVTCIRPRNSSVCSVQNEYWPLPTDSPVSAGQKPDQVRRQTLPGGEVWLYEMDTSAFGADAPPVGPRDLMAGTERTTYGSMADPLGNQTVVTYLFGIVRSVTGPAGVTRYTYNGLQPTEVIAPEGNRISFGYDEAGNNLVQTQSAKTGASDSVIQVQQTFPTVTSFFSQSPNGICGSPVLCNKPISRTDARGGVTDFTYDSIHGGVVTVTGPAVGGIRPQTRNDYVQRQAFVLDANGAYVPTGTPIWLLSQTSSCKTGAAMGNGCAIAGDEVITSYDYGPMSGANNLLLRGMVVDVGGLNLRTCYRYDGLGNRISETRPEGTVGLTACP